MSLKSRFDLDHVRYRPLTTNGMNMNMNMYYVDIDTVNCQHNEICKMEASGVGVSVGVGALSKLFKFIDVKRRTFLASCSSCDQ